MRRFPISAFAATLSAAVLATTAVGQTCQLFADINQSAAGASSSPLVVSCAFGSTLFVHADGGNGTGRELWAVDLDGNATLLRDINPGTGSSRIGVLSASTWTGSRAITVFSADDGTHGFEPWVTDGTPAGTMMLGDLYPGSRRSQPSGFAAHDGAIYFAADAPVVGRELWKTDGTTAGTVLVKDIASFGGSSPGALTSFRGKLYFFATSNRNLWESDGTTSGTVPVGAPGRDGTVMAAIGDRLWMSMADSTSDREVWTSDGTAAGTKRIDVYPGLGSSSPTNFTKLGDHVYFTAIIAGTGRELFRSDGTLAGTTLVRDINPASSRSSSPRYLTACGGRLYFNADDGTHGRELWVSDGTTAGTKLVADLDQGTSGSNPGFLLCAGSRLIFYVFRSPVGRSLYQTDGSPAGTTAICNPGPVSALRGAMLCGGRAVFMGSTPASGAELFSISAAGAFVESLGSGCGPTYPTLESTAPQLGQTVTLSNRRGPPNHIGVSLLGSPLTRPVTLPASNRCTQWFDLNLFVVIGQTTANTPSWQASFAVPNDPSLIDGTVVTQSLYLEQSTVFPLSASNALALTIGQ